MKKLVALAVRYQAMALRVALASYLALFLVAAAVALVTVPRFLVSASFAFFMGLVTVSWGVVLIADWFGKTKTPSRWRVVRFVSRAFDRGGAVLLVFCFAFGVGVMLTAFAILMREVLRRL